MDLTSEMQELLRSALSAIPRTVSADQYMEIRQQIRVQVWIAVLQVTGRHQGKFLPTPEQRASDQRELRMPFLGEQPQEQWVSELDRLVQQEIELDNRYRALQWHAEEYLGETTQCSPEGYDFGGPGLLWESLTDGSVFGEEGEPTIEDLIDYRESMLSLTGVPELKPDLEYLVRKEQHLERAYRELLEHVQQHALEVAVDSLEMADPKAEVLTTGQSFANLCPAPTTSPGFYGQEMVDIYPQTPVPETGDLLDFSAEEDQPEEPSGEELASGPYFTELCLAPVTSSGFYRQEMVSLYPQAPVPETGDLMDFFVEGEPPSEPPAEALAERQNTAEPSSTPMDSSEAQAEKVVVLSQWVSEMQGGEAAIPPPQRGFVHLGDSTSERVSQQQTVPQNDDTNPAEALATGQRVQDLCPTTAAVLEAQGKEVVVTSEQKIRSQGVYASSTSQQHDGVSSATLSSLQRLKGLQREGPVYNSSQRQVHSMREAEVGWVSNVLFRTMYWGYCVGTDIGGLELTNFGVNPFGVSSCVSLLPKGEICDGSHFGWGACGTQNTSERSGGSLYSSMEPSYV